MYTRKIYSIVIAVAVIATGILGTQNRQVLAHVNKSDDLQHLAKKEKDSKIVKENSDTSMLKIKKAENVQISLKKDAKLKKDEIKKELVKKQDKEEFVAHVVHKEDKVGVELADVHISLLKHDDHLSDELLS